MRLTKAAANNVIRFNWNGVTDTAEFKIEYADYADQEHIDLFEAISTHRRLTPEQALLLSFDMELIISRAEDSLDTTLFCGEYRDAIGDRATLNSMRRLNKKLQAVARNS